MKKIILALFAISILLAGVAAASDSGRSRSRKAAMEKAKCEKILGTDKEDCLKAIEEKNAKRNAISKDKK